jgi:phosphoribosylformylglycinamidine synthase
MRSACLRLNTPVTGGNVSFYNQSSDGTAVFPTPTIGMVGLLEEDQLQTGLAFEQEGDLIYLVGPQTNCILSSQYLCKYLKVAHSDAPYFDLDIEVKVQKSIQAAIRKGYIASAHDVSEGGLIVTLFEKAMPNGWGADVCLDTNAFRLDALLFGEGQSRIVVSIKPQHQSALEDILQQHEVPFTWIGRVTGTDIKVNNHSMGEVKHMQTAYDHAIEECLES